MKTTKELYVRPALTKHELLRDITATFSGGGVIRDRITDAICKRWPNFTSCN